MLALALAALEQAACLPLDDLSSYSSTWQLQPVAAVEDDRLDASTAVDVRIDGGAEADADDAELDASSPLDPVSDAAARPPDAGERPVSDPGPSPDAGEPDAAPAP